MAAPLKRTAIVVRPGGRAPPRDCWHNGGVSRFRHCPDCGAATRPHLDEGRERDACLACGRLWYQNAKPCATALIEDAAGRVLLVRRGIEPYKGLWNLPGGFLEVDEHPETGACREALEETGLEVALVGLLGIYLDWFDGAGDPRRAHGSLSMAYRARPVGGALRETAESTEAAWFAADALPPDEAIAYPNHRRTLADWRELVKSTSTKG